VPAGAKLFGADVLVAVGSGVFVRVANGVFVRGMTTKVGIDVDVGEALGVGVTMLVAV